MPMHSTDSFVDNDPPLIPIRVALQFFPLHTFVKIPRCFSCSLTQVCNVFDSLGLITPGRSGGVNRVRFMFIAACHDFEALFRRWRFGGIWVRLTRIFRCAEANRAILPKEKEKRAPSL